MSGSKEDGSEAKKSGVVHEHEFGSDEVTYEELEGGKVRCLTCAHECVIPVNGSGFCAVRKNVDGHLKLIVYGSAMCVNARDPIEKKPLYHVMSGSKTFSMATVGCNFACEFCQNDDLSQCTKDLKKKLIAEGNPEMLDIEVGALDTASRPRSWSPRPSRPAARSSRTPTTSPRSSLSTPSTRRTWRTSTAS